MGVIFWIVQNSLSQGEGFLFWKQYWREGAGESSQPLAGCQLNVGNKGGTSDNKDQLALSLSYR